MEVKKKKAKENNVKTTIYHTNIRKKYELSSTVPSSILSNNNDYSDIIMIIYTYYKTKSSAASVCLLTKNSKTTARIFLRFSPIDRVILPENTVIWFVKVLCECLYNNARISLNFIKCQFSTLLVICFICFCFFSQRESF